MQRRLALGLVVAVALTSLVATGMSAAGTSGRAAAAAGLRGTKWRPHVRAARRYAQRRVGNIRFAVIGLHGGMARYHAERGAPLASTFKVLLLAAYLHRPSVRDRGLTNSDTRLLGPMIRRSDNNAATRVRDIVGQGAIERLAQRAGMRSFKYNQTWGLSRDNPRDFVGFMYHFERFIPKRHEHYARHLLSSIVPSQRWGVARARPPGWKLRFKGGWGVGTGRVEHQVAFLDRKGWRVALAIFTEFSPSHGYGEATEEGVAKRLLKGLRRLPKHP